jgi:hypothetical protein
MPSHCLHGFKAFLKGPMPGVLALFAADAVA